MSKEIIKDSRLLDIYPKEWSERLTPEKTTVFQYRNLQHFKQHVSTLEQRDSSKCGIEYNVALKELLSNTSTIPKAEYEIIKNKVKSVLMKRGLISDTIYESYKYATEGGVVDVAKVVAQDPMCCLVPNESYTNYFYELYISISYSCGVDNSTIMENMAKILATIELLEQEHYYCKVTLVFPDEACNTGSGKSNLLVLIPLFSHKDPKSIETMSAVLNDRLLRKFCFAILEDTYKGDLAGGYGMPVNFEHTINVGHTINEIEIAEEIINKVIVPGTR